MGVGRLIEADILIAHNGLKFDLPVIRHHFPNTKINGLVRDTLICSRLIWPEIGVSDSKRLGGSTFFPPGEVGSHSLKAWGYRLGVLKGDFNNDQTDWSQWTAQMQAYCEQDVKVTAALWRTIESKKYSEEAIELEHAFAEVIRLQEGFGFRFDVKKASELYARLAERRGHIEGQLQAAFGPTKEYLKTPQYYTITIDGETAKGDTKSVCLSEAGYLWNRKTRKQLAGLIESGPPKFKEIPFNPGSRQQIAERLMERGWKARHKTPTGQPMVDEASLGGFPEIPETKLLIEYLTIQKRIGQVAEGDNAWLKLERNGRIHGRVTTNGAVTGRCTHQKPNMAQVPAVRKNKQKEILMGYEGGWGWECRSLFIADPGYSLVGADASGLEIRCLAHFLARYDGGAYARIVLHGDIHTENQKLFGVDTRDQAKTTLYAVTYGAGDAKLGSIVGGGPADGAEIRARFMRNLPAYANLVRDIKRAVKTQGYLKGLDGRQLPVRSSHSALNTLLQSAGALLVKKATVVLHDRLRSEGLAFGKEYANCVHIHDELQLQVREGLEEQVGAAAVGSIQAAGEHFKFRIPITGEWKAGKSWAITH